MSKIDSGPCLTLRFSGEEIIELSKTEFYLFANGKKIETLVNTAGKGGKGTFEWREGVQALCHCLIKYRCSPKDQLLKGIRFVYPGGSKSPASTLDYVVKKSNIQGCWQINVFGTEGESCRIKKYIKLRHSTRGGKTRLYKSVIQHQELPQESIIIVINGEVIEDLVELETLADSIEDQWYATPGNESGWAKVKQSRKQRSKDILGRKTRATIEKGKKPETLKTGASENAESITRKEAVMAEAPTPPLASKPLAELFKSLPVTSIISHITAAYLPARGSDAIEKYSAEILSSECVNVLAEKVISESISSFCDFFCAEFDPPHEAFPLTPDELSPQKIKDLRFQNFTLPDIKKCVGVVIASNRGLYERLATKVAKCNFSDMWNWFSAMSFFHERQSERKIVHEVERALNAAAGEPDFKEKFLPYAPERLPSLIKYFSDYDCVVAARIFERINEEGRQEEIRINRILNSDVSTDKL